MQINNFGTVGKQVFIEKSEVKISGGRTERQDSGVTVRLSKEVFEKNPQNKKMRDTCIEMLKQLRYLVEQDGVLNQHEMTREKLLQMTDFFRNTVGVKKGEYIAVSPIMLQQPFVHLFRAADTLCSFVEDNVSGVSEVAGDVRKAAAANLGTDLADEQWGNKLDKASLRSLILDIASRLGADHEVF